ncbi:MAG: ABC transporter permease [Candidatus Doudnabacteria bacterium]|nr:ABC transporter permease [Candidatus Doudnabacteria bacterium]
MSFIELLKANLKIVYRDAGGLFWTIALPVVIYCALSLLPINRFFQLGFSYSHFVLPGIIAYVIMQGGIYGLGYWMVDMRAQGVIKRFLVTPLKQWELALAVVVSRLVVMLAQVALLTVIGVIFFRAPFYWNIISIFVITVLGGGIFLMLGLLISTMAGSYQSAAPITAGIGLPLTFLGNMFFPITALPIAVQWVAKVLPITHVAQGLRAAYSAPFSFAAIQTPLLVLLVWLIIMLGLTVWRFRLKE